jgi:hypothetical protein
MNKFHAGMAIVAAASAAVLLPVSSAIAKDSRRTTRPPVVSPTPPPPTNTGPLDVTNWSFSANSFTNVNTGVKGPVEVHAIVVVGGPTYTTYDEVFINVRRVGGVWDRALDFPYSAQPVSFGEYHTIMLSTARAYAPGKYEARIAARKGTTWIYDEVIAPFTMP